MLTNPQGNTGGGGVIAVARLVAAASGVFQWAASALVSGQANDVIVINASFETGTGAFTPSHATATGVGCFYASGATGTYVTYTGGGTSKHVVSQGNVGVPVAPADLNPTLFWSSAGVCDVDGVGTGVAAGNNAILSVFLSDNSNNASPVIVTLSLVELP